MTGPELASALKTLGWSRYELAERSGLSEATVRRIAAGGRPVPASLAKWLQHAADWFDANPVPTCSLRRPSIADMLGTGRVEQVNRDSEVALPPRRRPRSAETAMKRATERFALALQRLADK